MTTTHLGPFFSHLGFAAWDWWLTRDAIHAVRHGVWHTIRLSSWQYIGFPSDPSEPDNLAARRGRHYAVSALLGMRVTRRMTSHNEVMVTLQDGSAHIYGIYDHSRTNHVRQRLSSMYPSLYSEVGF